MAEGGRYVDWFKMWKPDVPGICTIKTIVWSGVDEDPIPLSETNVMTVMVK